MKTVIIATLLAIVMVVGNSTHLRTYQPQHQFLNLDSMNPLQIAGLMSGDWTAILPASIQPIVRKLLGKEQQTGVTGFLNKAQGLLGGGAGNSLLGGMGGLFGQASQTGSQSGLSGLLGNLGGAFGGNAASSFGLPSIPGITTNSGSGLSGIVSGITNGISNGASGGASGVSGLLNNLIPRHE